MPLPISPSITCDALGFEECPVALDRVRTGLELGPLAFPVTRLQLDDPAGAVGIRVGQRWVKAQLEFFPIGKLIVVRVEIADEQLNKLKPLTAPQLLQIAQALNSDATLTEKSPKAKILKQITEMVRRVWKTSDNVNH